jgi:hypothetical protein
METAIQLLVEVVEHRQTLQYLQDLMVALAVVEVQLILVQLEMVVLAFPARGSLAVMVCIMLLFLALVGMLQAAVVVLLVLVATLQMEQHPLLVAWEEAERPLTMIGCLLLKAE